MCFKGAVRGLEMVVWGLRQGPAPELQLPSLNSFSKDLCVLERQCGTTACVV